MAQGTSTGTETTEERKARLRELVSRESGEITVLERSTLGSGAVFVGYSSGTVMHCSPSEPGCVELVGTPSTAVQDIVASPQGASEVIWVSYAQGALYRCVETQCRKLVRREKR